jgi:hypothetical protein
LKAAGYKEKVDAAQPDAPVYPVYEVTPVEPSA